MIRQRFLSIPALLLLPLAGLGQSYEWVDRIHSGSPLFTPVVSSISATDHGLYSTAFYDCEHETCQKAYVSSNRPEDGKRLWRRLVQPELYTLLHAVVASAEGVYVSGQTGPDRNHQSGFVRGYSHDGQALWTRRSPDGAQNFGIAADLDGLYVIETKAGGSAFLRQLDPGGKEVWAQAVPSGGAPYATFALGDGELFVSFDSVRMYVYRTTGEFVRSIGLPPNPLGQPRAFVYHNGYLYLSDRENLTKVSVDGEPIWTLSFTWDRNGMEDIGGLTVDDHGLLVTANTARPACGQESRYSGEAIVRVGFDGSIEEIIEYPGQTASLGHVAVLGGNTYVTGGKFEFGFGFIGRVSNDKPLIPRSIRVLAGHGPASPPRLAALDHDHGIGPVRVGIQDATGSDEIRFRFSEDLQPVGFDTVADLNGNGYEELVVVSRLPAVAEVRDSFDGSLVSVIELGSRFDPVTATVTRIAGAAPRLAVVVRNEMANRTLVREHALTTGDLTASIGYDPDFEPVDILAMSAAAGGTEYAVLGRSRDAASPHNVAIRSANAGGVENFWMLPGKIPVELASLQGGSGLAVLRYDTNVARPSVRQIVPDAGTDTTVRFVFENYRPVRLLVVPDTDGNGAPQLAVLGEHRYFKNNKVRVEMRDAASGAMNYRIDLDPCLRADDAVYVGPLPGYSESAMAFALRLGAEQWTTIVLIDAAAGSELYSVSLNSYVD